MADYQISQKPFRILSIDGGGLRGIVVVEILKWIETNILKIENPNASIHNSFDLFAGTSTGGLIACALTISDKDGQNPLYTLEDIGKIYEEKGKSIFPLCLSAAERSYTWIQNKFGPKYDVDGLLKVLNEKFENKRILDCSKNIFIPTYDVSKFRPIYFTSRRAKLAALENHRNASKFNCKLTDICLATSAAPTYFPSFPLAYSDESGYNDNLNCIDGGVYMNNPALAAYIEVLSNPLYYRGEHKIDEKDIYILSIGTGKVTRTISEKEGKKWGEMKWAKKVIDAAMLGSSQTVEEQLHSILPNRYLRINLDIDSQFSELDDSSTETLNYLVKQVVKKDFAQNQAWEMQLRTFKNWANL
jgi:patatin-like phospholipase/acyl hydrolase